MDGAVEEAHPVQALDICEGNPRLHNGRDDLWQILDREGIEQDACEVLRQLSGFVIQHAGQGPFGYRGNSPDFPDFGIAEMFVAILDRW